MRSLKTISAVALISTVLLASGCASIINDKTQKVNVMTSNGSKVTGTVDGRNFEAPGVVELTRAKQDKIFLADGDNCAKQTVATKKVDSVFFINLLSGGAYGSTTDYVTDKMWKYDDNITISCK